MSKKTLIVIGAILGLFLISLVGYYFIIAGNGGVESNNPIAVFKNFFPFGGNDLPTNTGIDTPATSSEPGVSEPNNDFIKKLRKLSDDQVSGAGIADVKAGSVVRYIERATGHIYEVEMFSPNKNRISNTTIPVVYDAVWGNNNNSLVTRYLEGDDQTVDSYLLTVKSTSTTTENMVSAAALPINISDVSVFGTSMFYLTQSPDSSTGYISNFDGTKKVKVWSSPMKEFLSQYVNAKTVALTTKPDPGVIGYMYFVDTVSGQVSKIIDGLGLSTLAHSGGTEVLYVTDTDTRQMFVLDIKNNLSKSVTPRTYPEKCVWSKKNAGVLYCAVPKEAISAGSLKAWYGGFISNSDDIWRYDTTNNTASLIENLANDAGQPIDVIKPILSENEQYLIFINKTDNALWSLDLMQS